MDDSLAPRGNIERASSKKELVDSALSARLKRMEGAHYVSEVQLRGSYFFK